MKRWFWAMCFAVALTGRAAPMGLLVPAYFYPPVDWDGLNFAAGRVPLVAIMNPGNGPGTAPDANYAAAANSLRAAGGRVIGYVYSSYAARDTNVIRADIDRFFSFYPLDGIFVDEMANDAGTNQLNYYTGLYQYIRTKGTNLLVVGNPGINTPEPYLTRPTADVLVTFESNTGYPAYVADGWVTNHLARQFCHLAYATTNAATMTNYVDLAAGRNAGWVFVTDDSGANPYDRLPVYWTNEVNYIRSLNLAMPATQLKMLPSSNRVPMLQISGSPGAYEVQTSSDLANWSVIATVSSLTNQLVVSDASATNLVHRFYRTRR